MLLSTIFFRAKIRIVICASIFFTMISTLMVLAQTIEYVEIGKDAFAFHNDKFPKQWVKLAPPVIEDAEIFIEMIGIPNISKINELKLGIVRSYGLKNAAALYRNGFRLIVYDPQWAKIILAEFYLVLGHEAGHHFCEHTIGSMKTSPRRAELDADRFSGASLKRFEVYHNKNFITDALKAAAKLYPIKGSRLHPPQAKRLEAIMLGYEEGSTCGNLLPGILGFSRQPR